MKKLTLITTILFGCTTNISVNSDDSTSTTGMGSTTEMGSTSFLKENGFESTSTTTSISTSEITPFKYDVGQISDLEAYCGDGVISKNEQCDDNSPLCKNCELESKVFVSSILLSGNFDGIENANKVCQNLANLSELSGEFKAWLSDGGISPIFYLQDFQGKFVRIDGEIIAENWQDLIDEKLLVSISIDENGNKVNGNNKAWTNTNEKGTVATEHDCITWKSAEKVHSALVGFINYTDGNWTNSFQFDSCDSLNRIYCFQVG